MRNVKSARLRILTATLAPLIAVVTAAPAMAQSTANDQEDGRIQEIIVTANKRAENLQKVPIAITAVTSEALAKAGITSTLDIAQAVPGLVIQQSMNGTQAHLRGVGTTAIPAGTENSIATYIDGVYILSLSGSLLQLNSIEQIEVLRGPQGTLYGRNATGGVINVRTLDPKHDLGGNLDIRYGNYDTVSGQGYITGGLSEDVAMDLAGYFSLQGKGWGKNLFNGRDANEMDEYAVRTKWLIEPTDSDEIRIALDFSKATGSQYNSFALQEGASSNWGPGTTTAAERPDQLPFIGPALAPFAVVGDPFVRQGGFYDITQFTHPSYTFKHGGGSLQWDHDFGSMRFTSITAYRRAHKVQEWSASPVPADTFHAGWTEKESQFSQEVQVGSTSGSPIQWVAGLYYLYGKASYPRFQFGGTAYVPLESITFRSFTSTKSGAAFGQVTAPIWEGANITGGLRYSVERRAITGDTTLAFPPSLGIPDIVTGITDAHKTFRKLTWRLSLDQQITPEVLGYLSYNRGFKSGIYNSIPAGGPGARPVEPEVLDSYEAGLKMDLFDRRLRLNLAGFYYDYSNLQVTVFTTTGANIENGAKAKLYGVDMDLTGKIGSNLTLTAGANIMHSEFTSYPNAQFLVRNPVAAGGGVIGVPGSAKGNELPYAPNYTFNVGADYSAPVGGGTADLGVKYSYSGRWFSGPDNLQKQDAYGLLNATASYTLPGDQIRLGLWARNITKTKYYVFLNAGANPGGYEQGIVGAPRTYGVSVGYKF